MHNKSLRYRPYWCRGLHLKQVRLMLFQQRAVRWMAHHRRKRDQTTGHSTAEGIILNMDYGLGKTVMSLSHALMFGWNALYVCPTTVFSHIRAEITKHFGSTVRCLEAKQWDPIEFAKNQITLMSYHTLSRLDVAKTQAWPYMFTTCIVDELEDAIKKDMVAKHMRTLVQSRFFVGLTGANRIEEKMLAIVRAETQRDVYTFRQCSNFVLETQLCELSETCQKEYNHIKHDVASKNGLVAHRLLQKARALVSADKVNRVLGMLSQIQGHKVLVVSEFVTTLEHISLELRRYKQNNILFVAAHLKTQAQRDFAISEFEKPTSKFNVMLADSRLIGFGLDFGFVDVMIVVDLPQELLFYRQLQGRLRRLGQHPKKLAVQHVVEVVTKDTCDFTLYNDIHSSKKYKI